LAEFLRPFHAHFVRSEGREALERYLTGLLTEQPTKNCNTIAEVVPGTSEQRLQGLLTNMVWDHDDLNDQRVRQMLTLPTEGDGVLVFDDTGFAKQGKCSVGVKRQYSGTLGRTGNCQITVNCHYAERTLAWPVSTRLYLPKKEWADDPERRQKAKVPQEVAFQTKPEIALALLDQARALGVPHCCITADADYGDNPNFLAGLELRRERYVVAVRCDFVVATERGEPGQRADALIAAQPRQLWRSIRWREGSKGWLKAPFVAVRGWRVRPDGKRRAGWLIGEDSSDGKRRYYWSNLGPKAKLAKMVGYAHRRHWVEQYHEEAKGLLGWDQYQGRLWHGFHRHAVSVMLAYSFLVWQEWQQRQKVRRRGRPRRPFSPSARPQAPVPARGPSPHRRLASA
jgi:SRSO17 transposase